jgi:choline dehydrogenase-like flavoprotein
MGLPAVHGERILHPVFKDQARSDDIVVAMGESQHESDVVVEGARCDGAAAAMLLARVGYRVTVVERGRSPHRAAALHPRSDPRRRRDDGRGDDPYRADRHRSDLRDEPLSPLDEFVALQQQLSRALDMEADFLALLDLPVAA